MQSEPCRVLMLADCEFYISRNSLSLFLSVELTTSLLALSCEILFEASTTSSQHHSVYKVVTIMRHFRSKLYSKLMEATRYCTKEVCSGWTASYGSKPQCPGGASPHVISQGY